jgi:xanthine/uracil/vitamin C permease (AzgA family)
MLGVPLGKNTGTTEKKEVILKVTRSTAMKYAVFINTDYLLPFIELH